MRYVLSVALALIAGASWAQSGGPGVGEPMPALTVQTSDGVELALGDLGGRAVVLSWWHPTCSVCLAEMPSLNALVERYGDRDDIAFVAVTSATPDAVAARLERFPFAFRQTFLDAESAQAVFEGGYPEHVVVAPDGTIALRLLRGSPRTADELDEALRRVTGS